MSFVIGVDTGGTFTDAFISDEDGRVASAKSSSTPPDFARGFLNVIDELATSMQMPTHDMLQQTRYIVHGTTSTLNSLVTGDVAQVGFLTTRGHADSISIMNVEGRYAGLSTDQIQNMSATNKPEPLVPRRRVREIDERIDYKGAEIVPLDESGVRDRGPSTHPRRGRSDRGLTPVVLPRPDSRTAHPRADPRRGAWNVRRVVQRSQPPHPRVPAKRHDHHEHPSRTPAPLPTSLPWRPSSASRGFEGALLVMQGSGGCVTAANAPANAISTIGSVLTGGIVGCQRLAHALGHNNIISTDIGGTTFLVGLVIDGEPVTATSTVLNQYTISSPMVDVHTIGAGGGAIAWLDAGQQPQGRASKRGSRSRPSLLRKRWHRAHRD